MDTKHVISTKRRSLGMNQVQFAELVGVDQATVSRWENGKCIPSKPVLAYIDGLKVRKSRRVSA